MKNVGDLGLPFLPWISTIGTNIPDPVMCSECTLISSYSSDVHFHRENCKFYIKKHDEKLNSFTHNILRCIPQVLLGY